MKNINLNIIMLGYVFILGCSKVNAHSWESKSCEDLNFVGCWKCGTNCTAKLDTNGELVVSGTGSIAGGSNTNTSFSGLSVKPTSLKIEEGITYIGGNAFWGLRTIKEVILADSVETIDNDGLGFINRDWKLTMSQNSALEHIYGDYENKSSFVFCKGNTESCSQILSNATSLYNGVTVTDEIKDKEGHVLEKCSASGCVKYDTAGNILGGYDFYGNLIIQYDVGGNIIAQYDLNGNEIYKRRMYTPAEATAVTSAGKGNKNIFKIRYR